MRTLVATLGVIALAGLATAEPASASFGAVPDAGLWGGLATLVGLGIVAVGMACSTELGAALRGGHCAPMPAPRNWVRVDALDSSRVVLGVPSKVRWMALDNRDPAGRYNYVKSIAIRGSVVFTTGANNDAVSAYNLRSLINQIDLTDVGNHKYWAAADGRDVIDDHYYRHGRLPYALDGAIALNLGALAGRTRRIDIEFALVSRAVGASPLEGLIPVAAFQKATSEAMQFTPQSTIKGSPAGITVTGFQMPDGTAGLEVWAEIVALAPLVADVPPVLPEPWMVRSYVLQGKNQVLESPDRKTSYAHIRFYPEDAYGGTGGQMTASDISGLTVEVGTRQVLGAYRQVDLTERGTALKKEGVTGFGDSADALGLADMTLPAEAGVSTPDVYVLPWRPTEDAPAGPVIVRMDTMPATSTRWLHRTVGCDTGDRAAKIKAAMGCECPVLVTPNTPNGGFDGSLPKILTK